MFVKTGVPEVIKHPVIRPTILNKPIESAYIAMSSNPGVGNLTLKNDHINIVMDAQ